MEYLKKYTMDDRLILKTDYRASRFHNSHSQSPCNLRVGMRWEPYLYEVMVTPGAGDDLRVSSSSFWVVEKDKRDDLIHGDKESV